jgi:hypothetical protein
MEMNTGIRRSVLIAFWAWVVFVLAGMGFYGLLDDNPLSKLAPHVPALELSVLAVQAGAVMTLVAVAAGGLPIAWMVLRFGVSQRRSSVLALLAVPLLCALALGAACLGLVIIGNTMSTPATPAFILFFGIAALFPVLAVGSTAAISAAVVRTPVREAQYRLARLPAIGLVAAMGLTLAAVLIWGVSASLVAPLDFHGAPGLLAVRTDWVWAGVMVGMTAASTVALMAVAHSFAAGHARCAEAGDQPRGANHP